MKKEGQAWRVYLLTCSDGSLYCGVTKDIENRLALHNQGKASKYTRSRLPVHLAGATGRMDKSQAFRLENRIKQLKPREKLAALNRKTFSGEFETPSLSACSMVHVAFLMTQILKQWVSWGLA